MGVSSWAEHRRGAHALHLHMLVSRPVGPRLGTVCQVHGRHVFVRVEERLERQLGALDLSAAAGYGQSGTTGGQALRTQSVMHDRGAAAVSTFSEQEPGIVRGAGTRCPGMCPSPEPCAV